MSPTDLATRPELARLSDRLGIERAYHDLRGELHETSVETAEVLCASLGFEAFGEAAARASIEMLEAEDRARLVEPVRVWRETSGSHPELEVRGHLPSGSSLVVAVEGEEAECWRSKVPVGGSCEPTADAIQRIALPTVTSPGVYEVRVDVEGREPYSAVQRLIVAPRTALTVAEQLGGSRAFGLWTNLYTLRSRRNWGFGDIGDASRLLEACAEAGGDFVGVNPLHAIPNAGTGVSPYSPVSRFYRNVLYIDVEAVPEWAVCQGPRRPEVRERLERLRAAPRLAHEEILAFKLECLTPLFAEFERRESRVPGERGRRFAAYRKREGRALIDFATFEVLAVEQGSFDWRSWPTEFQDRTSPSVARFREEHEREITFQIWLQFELDEQLAAAAEQSRRAGMRVGLYQDLAVGSARDSADTWMFDGAFVPNMNVGAPPDDFAPEGQDWGLPPLDPHNLRADGYRLFERLLDACMRHTGALRIDHVMGLQRQFFIPSGQEARHGAYVRFPLDDLLGVVSLASRRHETLVVGEDLGTVPADLPGKLASWGILSSCVLVFERHEQRFRAAHELSPRALATVNTHDLPPLAGYITGHDLELRRAAGAIASDAALAAALADRRADVAALCDRLREEGLLMPGEEPSADRIQQATAEFLARSPAPIVGISLDDLAGETEPINLPGIPADIHPSWTRRMQRSLEDLIGSPALRAALANGLRCR